MSKLDELIADYLSDINRIARREQISNTFIEQCVCCLAEKIQITDETFVPLLFNALCVKQIIGFNKRLADPDTKAHQLVEAMNLNADEITLSRFIEEDIQMMQQQSISDKVGTIKIYHTTQFDYMKKQIEKMKTKYYAESVGEIVAHFHKELSMLTMKHKLIKTTKNEQSK